MNRGIEQLALRRRFTSSRDKGVHCIEEHGVWINVAEVVGDELRVGVAEVVGDELRVGVAEVVGGELGLAVAEVVGDELRVGVAEVVSGELGLAVAEVVGDGAGLGVADAVGDEVGDEAVAVHIVGDWVAETPSVAVRVPETLGSGVPDGDPPPPGETPTGEEVPSSVPPRGLALEVLVGQAELETEVHG